MKDSVIIYGFIFRCVLVEMVRGHISGRKDNENNVFGESLVVDDSDLEGKNENNVRYLHLCPGGVQLIHCLM